MYTGIYSFENDNSEESNSKIHVISEQEAVSIQEILEKVNGLGREVVFLGDGVSVNEKYIRELVKVPYRIAPAHLRMQNAASVGRCALKMISEEKLVSAMDFAPEYLRLSQAERERMDKEKANAEA